jgi:hypothetical protein
MMSDLLFATWIGLGLDCVLAIWGKAQLSTEDGQKLFTEEKDSF